MPTRKFDEALELLVLEYLADYDIPEERTPFEADLFEYLEVERPGYSRDEVMQSLELYAERGVEGTLPYWRLLWTGRERLEKLRKRRDRYSR